MWKCFSILKYLGVYQDLLCYACNSFNLVCFFSSSLVCVKDVHVGAAGCGKCEIWSIGFLRNVACPLPRTTSQVLTRLDLLFSLKRCEALLYLCSVY